ncbi:hypothetical protein VCHA53O466_50103 [Vibrio chagasii]|nr:hypothetical protein VCHA53O466_50103 [Vibrio chagasii]
METDPCKVLFATWTEDDFIEEMANCYQTVVNLKTSYDVKGSSGAIDHDKSMKAYRAAHDEARSAISTLAFIKLSSVASEEVKSTAENFHRECELRHRLVRDNLGQTLSSYAIKSEFNQNSKLEPVEELSEDACTECETEGSLSMLLDGSVYCEECRETYFP